MKQITVYIANDGTRFDSHQDCIEYEETMDLKNGIDEYIDKWFNSFNSTMFTDDGKEVEALTRLDLQKMLFNTRATLYGNLYLNDLQTKNNNK